MSRAPESWQTTVRRESDVPQVVAGAYRFCRERGASDLQAAEVATAASELANNLWMHTPQGGEVRLEQRSGDSRMGVELLVQDQGPGIADLALAMSEGYSSGGGLGCGLPGAQRLMDRFEIRSTPGEGTVIRAVKWLGPPARAASGRPIR